MNDSLEDRLQDLLATRARVKDGDLEPLRAYVGTLPPRRAPSRAGTWATIAAVLAVTVTGIGALALANGLGSSGAWVPPSSVPVEGDPARFADDPRFLACTAAAELTHGSGQFATHAFEIDHARDYRRHLPAMLRSPELEVDDPALMVVFEVFDTSPLPTPRPGEPSAEPTEARHDVCVVVGSDPGERNYYPDVDVTGLAVRPVDESTPSSPGSVTVRVTAASRLSELRAALEWLELWRGPVLVGSISTASDEVGWSNLEPSQYELRYFSLICGVRCDRLVVAEERCSRAFVLDDGDAAAARLTLDLRRACTITWDPPFDPAPAPSASPALILPADASWFDRDGLRQTATRTFPGPGHCGWESTVWLSFNGETYIRDPLGVLLEHLTGPYREVDAVPAVAPDTGLRSAYWHLFGSPEADEVYMVTPTGRIEVWALDNSELGCR